MAKGSFPSLSVDLSDNNEDKKKTGKKINNKNNKKVVKKNSSGSQYFYRGKPVSKEKYDSISGSQSKFKSKSRPPSKPASWQRTPQKDEAKWSKRLALLRADKAKNPNKYGHMSWGASQIKNALRLKNRAAVESGKTGMQDDQGDKGKGPVSNRVGSKPDPKTWPKGDDKKKKKESGGPWSVENVLRKGGSEVARSKAGPGYRSTKGEKSTNTNKIKISQKEEPKAPAPKKKTEAELKAAWLKKTRRSPAARSGAFSDDERWALHKGSSQREKDKQEGKLKREKFDPRKPRGYSRKLVKKTDAELAAERRKKELRDAKNNKSTNKISAEVPVKKKKQTSFFLGPDQYTV